MNSEILQTEGNEKDATKGQRPVKRDKKESLHCEWMVVDIICNTTVLKYRENNQDWRLCDTRGGGWGQTGGGTLKERDAPHP